MWNRFFDVLMMNGVNGRERGVEDWISIFKQADERFRVLSVNPIGNLSELRHTLGVIDVVFDEPRK
jgi:hypothetical protein